MYIDVTMMSLNFKVIVGERAFHCFLFTGEYSLVRAMEGWLCYELLRYITPHGSKSEHPRLSTALQELKEEDAEDGLEGSNPCSI